MLREKNLIWDDHICYCHWRRSRLCKLAYAVHSSISMLQSIHEQELVVTYICMQVKIIWYYICWFEPNRKSLAKHLGKYILQTWANNGEDWCFYFQYIAESCASKQVQINQYKKVIRLFRFQLNEFSAWVEEVDQMC